MPRKQICIARGDGIGPEIMDAVLGILQAAGAELNIQEVQVGEKLYLEGRSSGIAPEGWDALREAGVLLKAPITTPQGGGYRSLNVTLRTTLGLAVNVRPCVSLHPYVPTRHPGMNVTIVRENEEDLYSGIEHRQSAEVVQSLKLISRAGSERVIRYAFDLAVSEGRSRVTALVKDNIMKMGDGLFHDTFDQLAKDYPQIKNESLIVDIGMARVADTPARFDVIVLPNLYGDILSDITAQISGSVGLGGSANLGEHFAMFEAVHGSAPDIAGQDMANPSGLLMASCMMLRHIGQPEVAERIHNAWLATLEDGVHTGDLSGELTEELVGTRDFAKAVISRLGENPRKLATVRYGKDRAPAIRPVEDLPPVDKKLLGADVFVDSPLLPEELAARMQDLPSGWKLDLISSRGVRVWPDGAPETYMVGLLGARLYNPEASGENLAELLAEMSRRDLPWVHVEQLRDFEGARGYSEIPGP